IKWKVGTICRHEGHAEGCGRNYIGSVNCTENAGITYRLVELGCGTNKDNAKVLTENVATYSKNLVKSLTGTTNDKKPATSKPNPSKPSSSKPKPSKPSNKYNVAVDGSWGPDLTCNLQRYFGTTVDGVISGQPKNRSTQNIPSAKYGTSGSNLIRAM